MSITQDSKAAFGLDVGTSRLCLASKAGDGFEFKTELNAFVTIPYSRMTETVLQKADIPHTVKAQEIVVQGNESDRFAVLLNMETRRTMDRGILNSAEPDSLVMLRKIVTSLLDPARERTKLCFTIPAAPLGAESNLTYHEAALRQMLTERGYDAKPVNEGLAVIYAELESSNYTGIGISCGGGLCNVCFAYLSMPILSFSMPKAGDYIDQSASGVTGERANFIRMIKEESFHLNGYFADQALQALGVYYDDMIHALVAGMKEAFANTRNKPKVGKPVPVVLSGGTTLPPGFRDRFEKILKETDFPIQISEIRMASDPLHTSAKGALVAALTEN